jgi:predicted transcriptional regulator
MSGWVRSSASRMTLRKVNRQVITIKVSNSQREALRRLSGVSERPISWMVIQAFNQLFRDLELAAVLPSEIVAKIDPEDQTVFLQLNLLPVWMDRLKRLADRSSISVSEIIRFALRRYELKRQPYLSGKLTYQDPFMEQGPRIPPR